MAGLDSVIPSPWAPHSFEVVQGIISTPWTAPNLPNYPWPYCGVQLQGNTAETLGLRFFNGYYPVLGDVVWCVWFGTDGFVLGMLEQDIIPPKTHLEYYRATSFAGSIVGPVIVVFDRVIEDLGQNYSPVSGSFTAPVSGYYIFNGRVGATATAGGQFINGIIYKNGSPLKKMNTGISFANGNIIDTTIAWRGELFAGETVQIYVNASPILGTLGPLETWLTVDQLVEIGVVKAKASGSSSTASSIFVNTIQCITNMVPPAIVTGGVVGVNISPATIQCVTSVPVPVLSTATGGHLVGFTTATTGAIPLGSYSITLPLGIHAGDQIFILAGVSTGDPAITPNGYADIGGIPVANGKLNSNIYWKTAIDASDSGQSVLLTVPAVPGSLQVPSGGVPPVNPGGGSGARAVAGTHADGNQYGPRNCTTCSWRGSAAFSGFTTAPGSNRLLQWNMIESAPDLGITASIYNDLATGSGDGGGPNFNDGVSIIPRMVFSIYGNFTSPAATVAQVAAGVADGALQAVCDNINLVRWPQIAIRYGWEIDGGWFSWGSNASDYINAFRHVRQVMSARLTVPVLWEWNAFAYGGCSADMTVVGNTTPNISGNKNSYGYNSVQYYPGDAYVDVVGCDSYCVNIDATDTKFLNSMRVAQAFAAARGKPVGYSEWGLWDGYTGGIPLPNPVMPGSGRDVRAIQAAIAFFDSLPATGPGSLAYHHYFDGTPAQLIGGIWYPTGYFQWLYFPNALAVYKQRMLLP